jgi:hypothetical protein
MVNREPWIFLSLQNTLQFARVSDCRDPFLGDDLKFVAKAPRCFRVSAQMVWKPSVKINGCSVGRWTLE